MERPPQQTCAASNKETSGNQMTLNMQRGSQRVTVRPEQLSSFCGSSSKLKVNLVVILEGTTTGSMLCGHCAQHNVVFAELTEPPFVTNERNSAPPNCRFKAEEECRCLSQLKEHGPLIPSARQSLGAPFVSTGGGSVADAFR